MSDLHDGSLPGRMGPRRHYSPGVVFHAPHCVEGGNALAVQVRAAIEVHPNYRFDACFGGLFPPHLANDPDRLSGLMPFVTVETVTYRRHGYRPSGPRDESMPQPPDAIRALCRVCRGTHEREA
jgi:hypothetical protein